MVASRELLNRENVFLCSIAHHPLHHSLPILLLVPLGSTASSPIQCSCASIHPLCCQVYFPVPLRDLCRIHNVCMPPPLPPTMTLHTRPNHLTQFTAVPLKATQVSFPLHVSLSFCSPPLPLVSFCHPYGAVQFFSLVRDVIASRCSAAFVSALLQPFAVPLLMSFPSRSLQVVLVWSLLLLLLLPPLVLLLLLLFFWQFKDKIKRNCRQTPEAKLAESSSLQAACVCARCSM